MYPVYKLIRSVNRQYPNNGFINAVSVDEETYADAIIPEDLKDIINECLQEIYKDVALEEIFSFPTVAGQNQYVLPDDCDLRDIVEVTRTGGPGFGHPPIGFIKPIEEIVNGGGRPHPDEDDIEPSPEPEPEPGPEPRPDPIPPMPPYPDPHYGGPYPGWVPNRYWGRRLSRRLVFARDAESLTGDRYFNAWNNKRIGISPTPTNNFEIITLYYKKRPKTIEYMDDPIQIKDEYMPILKYRVCMELAKSGSHPDIDMYNIFALEYNNLLTKAKREKDADKPYYDHVKDNDRPSAYYRRGPRRRWSMW